MITYVLCLGGDALLIGLCLMYLREEVCLVPVVCLRV